MLLLPQTLGVVERGEPVRPGEPELPPPEPDARAEHHRAGLLEVSSLECLLDRVLGHPERLVEPRRIGGGEPLRQDEPWIQRNGEGRA